MKRLLVACLVVLVAACGSESPAAPTVALPGTWHLKSVNGTNLPYVATEDTLSVSITAATLTISNDGTYNDLISASFVENGQVVNTAVIQAGNWSSSGGSVTFDDKTDGTTYSGSLSGAVLTLMPGSVDVYVQ